MRRKRIGYRICQMEVRPCIFVFRQELCRRARLFIIIYAYQDEPLGGGLGL
jgi:hypothetical protein